MAKKLRRSTDLAVVCWLGPDDELTTGCPLPVRYAEALARAFQNQDPARRYWIEPLPWLAALRRLPAQTPDSD
jgi:hypothetical protein